MPIIFFSVLSVIYLSFYLYDYNRIQGIADHILQKAILNQKHEANIETGEVAYDVIGLGTISNIFSNSENKEKDIEYLLYKKLSNELLVTKIMNIDVSVSLLEVEIKIIGELKIPIKGLAYFISLYREYNIKAKSSIHNPADTVRISEVILDMGSKFKGYDNLKETISRLIP